MGAANQRKKAGTRISHCRTCTLCCTVPAISILDKLAYHACCHLKDAGCSLFEKAERPHECIRYTCAYLSKRLGESIALSGTHDLPHPQECGAYFHMHQATVSGENDVVFIFVDPLNPERWKTSRLIDVFRYALAQDISLFITDRGRTMWVKQVHIFEAMLTHDVVKFADSEGHVRDIPSYAPPHPPQ